MLDSKKYLKEVIIIPTRPCKPPIPDELNKQIIMKLQSAYAFFRCPATNSFLKEVKGQICQAK